MIVEGEKMEERNWEALLHEKIQSRHWEKICEVNKCKMWWATLASMLRRFWPTLECNVK